MKNYEVNDELIEKIQKTFSEDDLELFIELLRDKKNLPTLVLFLFNSQLIFEAGVSEVNYYKKTNVLLCNALKKLPFRQSNEIIKPFVFEFNKKNGSLNNIKNRLKKENMPLYHEIRFFCGEIEDRGVIEMIHIKDDSHTFASH